MHNIKPYHVAISYSNSDEWIARDIAKLIRRWDFAVYFSGDEPDRAKGNLRLALIDIYTSSWVNVIVWSDDYARKLNDANSIVNMEYRIIVDRHVGRDEGRTLFVLSVDDAPMSKYLENVTCHQLHSIGVTGCEEFIEQRLQELKVSVANGEVSHPQGTERDRGQLHPCTFYISQNFARFRRWERLADIAIVAKENSIPAKPADELYLIPSGRATQFARHTHIFRTEPRFLDMKRLASIQFIDKYQGQVLKGFWFYMKRGEVEYPTVYCKLYDDFLNAEFETQL